PALLDLLDHVAERLVRRADQVRPLLALGEALREREFQELVHAPEDRREGAAREPLVLLVEEAERDEVRRLELGRPRLLGRLRLVAAGRPDLPEALEEFFFQVWGFSAFRRRTLEGNLFLDTRMAGPRLRLRLVSHARR